MKNLGTACLLVLMSCQNTGSKTPNQPDTTPTTAAAPQARDTTTLAGTWYLQAVLPSDTATGKTPWLYLNLEMTRFSGNTGCNSMHGKFYFSKTDSSFSFGDKFAISKMNCTGYNETAFLKSLKNTGRFKLHNGTLTLVGDDRTELSHWIRRQETPAKALKT